MTIALIAAALAVILWPSAAKPPAFTTFPGATRVPPPAPAPTSYQGAIQALATVRARLVATATLADPEKKAIDALTLALVAGSDKP